MRQTKALQQLTSEKEQLHRAITEREEALRAVSARQREERVGLLEAAMRTVQSTAGSAWRRPALGPQSPQSHLALGLDWTKAGSGWWQLPLGLGCKACHVGPCCISHVFGETQHSPVGPHTRRYVQETSRDPNHRRASHLRMLAAGPSASRMDMDTEMDTDTDMDMDI